MIERERERKWKIEGERERERKREKMIDRERMRDLSLLTKKILFMCKDARKINLFFHYDKEYKD